MIKVMKKILEDMLNIAIKGYIELLLVYSIIYRLVRSFDDDARREPPSGDEIMYVEVKNLTIL